MTDGMGLMYVNRYSKSAKRESELFQGGGRTKSHSALKNSRKTSKRTLSSSSVPSIRGTQNDARRVWLNFPIASLLEKSFNNYSRRPNGSKLTFRGRGRLEIKTNFDPQRFVVPSVNFQSLIGNWPLRRNQPANNDQWAEIELLRRDGAVVVIFCSLSRQVVPSL